MALPDLDLAFAVDDALATGLLNETGPLADPCQMPITGRHD